MELQPLSARFGAEVHDVDLATIDADGVAALRAALVAEQLLVIPGQSLDDAAHERLARLLGEPVVHPLGRLMGATPRVEHIVDDAEHPPFQDRWHTDISFLPDPPTFGILRAIDMPIRGGDTLWADAHGVLDLLSPSIVALLRQHTAWHDAGYDAAFRSKAGDALVDRMQAEYPGAEHPIVRTHPESGREYAYANRGFTRRIVGLRASESDALLGLLFEAFADPSLHHRHHWHVGDVVLWDERSTQHYATADHFPHRREMARMTVA
jgi:taurine dioxygenase